MDCTQERRARAKSSVIEAAADAYADPSCRFTSRSAGNLPARSNQSAIAWSARTSEPRKSEEWRRAQDSVGRLGLLSGPLQVGRPELAQPVRGRQESHKCLGGFARMTVSSEIGRAHV